MSLQDALEIIEHDARGLGIEARHRCRPRITAGSCASARRDADAPLLAAGELVGARHRPGGAARARSRQAYRDRRRRRARNSCSETSQQRRVAAMRPTSTFVVLSAGAPDRWRRKIIATYGAPLADPRCYSAPSIRSAVRWAACSPSTQRAVSIFRRRSIRAPPGVCRAAPRDRCLETGGPADHLLESLDRDPWVLFTSMDDN